MTYVNVFFVILGLDFHGAVGKGRLDFKDEADEYVTSSVLFTTISAVLIAFAINIFFSKLYMFLDLIIVRIIIGVVAEILAGLVLFVLYKESRNIKL